MREVLFRGWTREGGSCFVYGQFFWEESRDGRRVPKISGGGTVGELDGQYTVDEGSVAMFTGKLDRHGERIFEGDVLVDDDGNNYIVEWGEEEAGFYLFQESSARVFYFPSDMPLALRSTSYDAD